MTRVVDKQSAASSPPCDSSPMTGSVAVIGAGPGGLVAARWLLSQGFEPTIFERAPMLGGQWTGLDGRSGVWPTMHTNTSRILTAFSDLDHGTDVVCPSGRDILDYLHRYAEAFDLVSRTRFRTRVEFLSSGDAGWLVRHTGETERFDRVVVATGRFQSPFIPTVPGLDTFAGSAGITSTYQYRGPEPYRGKRVLVAGGAISAMEIAADYVDKPGCQSCGLAACPQRRSVMVVTSLGWWAWTACFFCLLATEIPTGTRATRAQGPGARLFSEQAAASECGMKNLASHQAKRSAAAALPAPGAGQNRRARRQK
jgi:hypothetical protein